MDIWKNSNYVGVGNFIDNIDCSTFGIIPLFKGILEKNVGHVTEYAQSGSVNEETVNTGFEGHQKLFEELGGRLVFKKLSVLGNKCTNSVFLWEDGMVQFGLSGSYMSLSVMSHREEFVQAIKDYFQPRTAKSEKRGHVYAIVQNNSQLNLSSIGNAGVSLVSENYTPKVIEDYRYVISDLQSEYPSGRIVIMRGTPGSGKTHLIRAMLLEVPDAMFVLISPEMVTSLAGPQLLPLLMSYHNGVKGPIVLILEDADKCLVARDKDNINSIQSLLNLGDGILGSLLDLRIVATTNAQELNMEEAIMRPGRLSKMLEVEALDLNTAINVFKRLCPDVNLPKQLKAGSGFKTTLAEMYSLARKHGWKPSARKVNAVSEKLAQPELPEEDKEFFEDGT